MRDIKEIKGKRERGVVATEERVQIELPQSNPDHESTRHRLENTENQFKILQIGDLVTKKKKKLKGRNLNVSRTQSISLGKKDSCMDNGAT